MEDSQKVVVCDNCHRRPGTIQWVGEGGLLAVTHGWYKMWCEICVVTARIKYAEKYIEQLPELYQKLADLNVEE